MMKNKNPLIAAALVLGLIATHNLSAQEATNTASPKEAAASSAGDKPNDTATPATAKTTPAPVAYTDKGADTCAKCHDEDSKFPVFAIFKTKHATQADKRTPFAGLQCESCHGPGAEHAKKVRPGEKQAPITTFGKTSKLTADKANPVAVAEQNKICLNCHQGNARIGWNASVHEAGNLACANCHKLHIAHDPILSKTAQPDVCFNCHLKQRADFFKTSTHPVRAGLMTCSECHKPHGAGAEKLLAKPTVNQTCYTCHAEKRGPFLWEHAPVAEDCTLCHNPHGSVHTALLKKSPPLICQQCHSVVGHPTVARTGAALPGGSGTPSAFLLAGSCNNCHSQVHGSNHPSGVKGMR